MNSALLLPELTPSTQERSGNGIIILKRHGSRPKTEGAIGSVVGKAYYLTGYFARAEGCRGVLWLGPEYVIAFPIWL